MHEPLFSIVGIGASAGGIEKLKKLFSSLKSNLNAAFVVVSHFSPEHKSTLPEILTPLTSMKVIHVKGNELIQKNHVYVIEPNTILEIKNGKFFVTQLKHHKNITHLIDVFFESLANYATKKSVAIILSGSGNDGSHGVSVVRSMGGVVVAENPESTENWEMPQNAINTGSVNVVAEISDISKIIEENIKNKKTDFSLSKEVLEQYKNVLFVLKKKECVDFNLYKLTTIIRRIDRRINLLSLKSIEEYCLYLDKNANESKFLCKEFLIGVTKFFRDEEVFNFIRSKVVEKLFENNDTVKVWIPACSTGEEAYTYSMILFDYLEEHNLNKSIQIFASDLDAESIAKARKGVYSQESINDVPVNFRSKYFEIHENGFRVCKKLRESIVFAEHNLACDPPYSKIDLISCRNVLIYMSSELQERLMELFLFGLKRHGYMVLGTSETPGPYIDNYFIVEKRLKIFRKVNDLKYSGVKWNLAKSYKQKAEIVSISESEMKKDLSEKLSIEEIAKKVIFDNVIHLNAIVNQKGDIFYLHGEVNKYFQIKSGVPTNNIIENAKDSIKIPIANTLRSAIKSRKTEIKECSSVCENNRKCQLRITVTPIAEKYNFSNAYLISIDEIPCVECTEDNKSKAISADNSEKDKKIIEIEKELFETRQYLNSTIEELEKTNEELTSSNEETQSVNEELQSSNEELESSKEELQATNEELTTLNSEYQSKIEELSKVNNDIFNFVRSSQIGMLFLDRDFKIVRFTPLMSDIVNILTADIGRSFNLYFSNEKFPGLFDDCKKVLETLHTVEKEYKTESGHTYLTRVIPYRTVEDKIEGIILTFFDISDRIALEENRTKAEQRFKLVFDNMTTGFALHEIIIDSMTGKPCDYRFLEVNQAFERITGLKIKDILGRNVKSIIPNLENSWIEKYGNVALTGQHIEFESFSADLSAYYRVIAFSPDKNQFAVIFQDVTAIKKSEIELKEKEEKFRKLYETIDQGIVYHDQSGKIIDGNKAAENILGLTYEQLIGKDSFDPRWKLIDEDGNEIPPESQPSMISLKTGKPVASVNMGVYIPELQKFKWIIVSSYPEFKENETKPWRVFVSFTDVTKLKEATTSRDKMQAQLYQAEKMAAVGTLAAGIAHEINNPLYFAMEYSDVLVESIEKLDISEKDKTKLLETLKKQQVAQDRIKNIVHGMKTYLKEDKTTAEVTNANKVLTDLSNLIESVYKQENIVFELEKRATHALVGGNSGRLSQVFMNLISNAKDSFAENAEKKHIKIVTENHLDKLTVTITDNGSGMSEEILAKIFDPFFTTKDVGAGVGLGLSIVQNIIAGMNGKIEISSKIGFGTIVKIEFKYIQNEEGFGSEKPKVNGNEKFTGDILVVDDEEDGRILTTRQFEKLGFIVDKAVNGKDASEKIAAKHYDYLITDIKMPVMDGIDLILTIPEEKRSKMKIIVLSGADVDEYEPKRVGLIKKYLFGSLKKPVSKDEIIRIFAQV